MSRPTPYPPGATGSRSSGADRLLDTAMRLFEARGYRGISVRELTKAAGVAPTVLYYHFGSKRGLYAKVLETADSEYRTALDRASVGAETTVERIRGVCREHARWRRRSVAARVVEAVERLVREGIERGEFDSSDPGNAALALVGTAEAAAARFPPGSNDPAQRRRWGEVLDVVLLPLVKTGARHPLRGRSR